MSTAGTQAQETPSGPVVDACSLVYDNDSWRAYLNRFRHHAPEYLDVFSRSFCRYFGVDHRGYRDALARGWDDAVACLVPASRPNLDLRSYLDGRAGEGVTAEIAMGGSAEVAPGESVNDRLLALTAADRERIHVWAGISLIDTGAALSELSRSLAAGATGICIIPFLDGIDITDPVHAPVIAAAENAGLPLWLHTGHHFAASQPPGAGNWRAVDELARRHPGLVIVAGHAGWPDVTEMLLTASRHSNVLLEFSSHRARTMRIPGAGWEMLLAQAGSLGRGRVMFGTSTWVNPPPVRDLVAEVRDLGLDPTVTQEWLAATAQSLMRRSVTFEPGDATARHSRT
jgi:predicted TIM-barrel fold metal-dependent hydrolase